MSCPCALSRQVAGAGAVSWLCAWWRQVAGAGAGAGCWAPVETGRWRWCWVRVPVPVLRAGCARGGDRLLVLVPVPVLVPRAGVVS